VRFSVNYTNALKIRVPAPFCQIMGVADPVAVNRTFVADLTALSHVQYLKN
jgi:hypothetical protein